MSVNLNPHQEIGLPIEMVTHVCRFLPKNSLGQAALVSRLWYSAVDTVCQELCVSKGWKKTNQLKGWYYQAKFNTYFSSGGFLEKRPTLRKISEIGLDFSQLNTKDKTRYLPQGLVIHGRNLSMVEWDWEERAYSGKCRLTTWNLSDGKNIQVSRADDELTCAKESTKLFTDSDDLQNEGYEVEAVNGYIKVKDGNWISVYFEGKRAFLFNCSEIEIDISEALAVSTVTPPLHQWSLTYNESFKSPFFAYNDRFIVFVRPLVYGATTSCVEAFSISQPENSFYINITDTIFCIALQENVLAIRGKDAPNRITLLDLNSKTLKKWNGFALTKQDTSNSLLETMSWEGCVLTLTALVSKDRIATHQWDFSPAIISPEKKPAYQDSPYVESVD